MKLCKKCNSLMNPVDGNSFKCIKCGFEVKGKDLIEIEKVPKVKSTSSTKLK